MATTTAWSCRDDAQEKENDYVMLSDIFPTGYHATELARRAARRVGGDLRRRAGRPDGGDRPRCIRGASRVFVVDTHKDRLTLAEKIGAIAIDDTEGGGVEQVLDLTGGQGADRGCECVGYQCCNMHGKEVPNLTMNNLVQTVKATGSIGVVGRVRAEGSGRAGRAGKSTARWRSTSASSGSRASASPPARPT